MAAADNIGSVVRCLRERWRLKQQDVVDYARLERSSSYISGIETGKTSPTLAELEAMAVVFRTTLIDMVREAQGERVEESATEQEPGRLVVLFRALPREQQELALDFLQLLVERRNKRETSDATKGS